VLPKGEQTTNTVIHAASNVGAESQTIAPKATRNGADSACKATQISHPRPPIKASLVSTAKKGIPRLNRTRTPETRRPKPLSTHPLNALDKLRDSIMNARTFSQCAQE